MIAAQEVHLSLVRPSITIVWFLKFRNISGKLGTRVVKRVLSVCEGLVKLWDVEWVRNTQPLGCVSLWDFGWVFERFGKDERDWVECIGGKFGYLVQKFRQCRWGSSLLCSHTRDPLLGPPLTLAEFFRCTFLWKNFQTSPPAPLESYPGSQPQKWTTFYHYLGAHAKI